MNMDTMIMIMMKMMMMITIINTIYLLQTQQLLCLEWIYSIVLWLMFKTQRGCTVLKLTMVMRRKKRKWRRKRRMRRTK